MSRHLVGAAEIRRRLGEISRQRVYQLAQRPDWPAPYDELIQGKVWRREDVEAWIKRHRPDLDSAAVPGCRLWVSPARRGLGDRPVPLAVEQSADR